MAECDKCKEYAAVKTPRVRVQTPTQYPRCERCDKRIK